MPGRVLLVDDEPAILESLSEALTAEGLEVLTAESAGKALGLLSHRPPDVVLSDVRMPGTDGLEFLRLLKERVPTIDVILMTAYEDVPTVVTAMQQGATDFLTKPLNLKALRALVDRVFRDRRARDRPATDLSAGRALDAPLDNLVGRDPAMIDVYKRVGQLARSRVPVLIRGETGTGKELVARAIHESAPWAHEPFVAVNCAAIPEGLLESELFGHVRGAFTGAVSNRRGRFQMAGRGTLFLDEIGDTDLGFQASLLRVLEERWYIPVGGERGIDVEARILAATRRELETEIEEGRFREDLYYRLRVVEIRLPPLRERADDIPRLAHHLVRKTAARLELPPPSLSAEAESRLIAHSWPGNVRELENCLTRAVALATGSVLLPEDLALGVPKAGAADLRSLEEVEREHVARVLTAVAGNKTRAADILGVSRPRLYRMIEKHGLDPGVD